MNDGLYEQMKRAQAGFHDQAMTIPGVHGTSIGKKHVAGEAAPTFAILVHLSKKKALEDVPVSERIPKQIGGFPTDVIEHDPPTPINDIEGGADLWVNGYYGTLGCIVRDKSDSKTCLLSNEHVLAPVGTSVYWEKNDACHKIGETKRVALTSLVDAGIASLDVGSLPSIAGIGPVAGTRIVTWEDIEKTVVRKSGRSTHTTYGEIKNINYQGKNAHGRTFEDQILIVPDKRNQKFADEGDSGSVIVDPKGFVLALLWSRIGEFVGWGVACRIENVMSALNIEVLTKTTVDAPLPYAETFEGELEALCAQSSWGRDYFQTYLHHRDEVQHLFHETTRLYATWRKIPQEAFMDAFRAGVRHPDGIIPATLNGEDTRGVLVQLRDAMAKYVENAELMRQMDSLVADLSGHIDATWQQAIAERDIPAKAPPAPRTDGDS